MAMETETYRNSGEWGLVLLQGIIALILGVFLMAAPGIALISFAIFVGAYWLVSGILSIVRIFTGANRTHWGWALFAGVIGVLAGMIVLGHPLYSAVILPSVLIIMLGISGLVMGFVNLGRGISGDGGGVVLIGIIDLILGLVLLSAPLVAATVLPVLAGIFAVLGGIALIVISFSLRGQRREEIVEEQKRRAA